MLDKPKDNGIGLKVQGIGFRSQGFGVRLCVLPQQGTPLGDIIIEIETKCNKIIGVPRQNYIGCVISGCDRFFFEKPGLCCKIFQPRIYIRPAIWLDVAATIVRGSSGQV